jgi:hypothetical protein
MYELINRNVAELLQTIDRKGDIVPYVWMIERLRNIDVAHDQEFQRVYRLYWRLNAAHLSQEFCSAYFSLLEEAKHSTDDMGVENIARALLKTQTHSNGKQSLQFSFATKLVHMLNPRLPVYDGMVESFFFLPSSYTKKTVDGKLGGLLRSYGFLVNEYDRILIIGLLAPAIAALRSHFSLDDRYADEKAIDTLVWRFVGLLQKGALRDGSIAYL